MRRAATRILCGFVVSFRRHPPERFFMAPLKGRRRLFETKRQFTVGRLVYFCVLCLAPAGYGQTDPVSQLKAPDPLAAQPLIAALKDTSPYVQWRSASTLGEGEIEDPRAVEPLISSLKDASPYISPDGASALGKINDPPAAQAPSAASPEPVDAQGLVYVYRRNRHWLHSFIFVNGVALGELQRNTYVQLSVREGTAAVAAISGDGGAVNVVRAFKEECTDWLSERCLAAVVTARDAVYHLSETVTPQVWRFCHVRNHGRNSKGVIQIDAGDLSFCQGLLNRAIGMLRSTLRLEIEVEGAKVYYVKWYVGFPGVKMEVVDVATAAKEVKGFHLAKDQ